MAVSFRGEPRMGGRRPLYELPAAVSPNRGMIRHERLLTHGAGPRGLMSPLVSFRVPSMMCGGGDLIVAVPFPQ